jgi:hypothetical protein
VRAGHGWTTPSPPRSPRALLVAILTPFLCCWCIPMCLVPPRHGPPHPACVVGKSCPPYGRFLEAALERITWVRYRRDGRKRSTEAYHTDTSSAEAPVTAPFTVGDELCVTHILKSRHVTHFTPFSFSQLTFRGLTVRDGPVSCHLLRFDDKIIMSSPPSEQTNADAHHQCASSSTTIL